MARNMVPIGDEEDFIHGPFNAEILLDDNGQPILDVLGIPEVDRQYDSTTFSAFFAQVISNGVFPNPLVFPPTGANSAGLQVMSFHNSRVLTMRPGAGFIRGRFFIAPTETQFEVPPAHLTLGRRDIIVLREDVVTRTLLPQYIVGAPAATPQIPTLERTDDFFELQLCVITVNPNAHLITQANIQDTRPNNNVCGFVTNLVQTVDTRGLFAQLETFFNEQIARFNAMFAQEQARFNNLGAEIRNLITSMETGAFSTLNFDFDDWFVRRGCNKNTTFLANGNIRTEYRVVTNNFLAAFMDVSFPANGNIIEATTFAQWEMMQGSVVAATFPFTVTKTTIFNADGSIREEIR